VIEPESGRTLLDTRGQDGAAPAVEFQTGTQAAFHVPLGMVRMNVAAQQHEWLVSSHAAASQRVLPFNEQKQN
jgi:hypothetical protein